MRSAGERFNRTNQSFFMKWDTLERRAKFSTEKIGPFSWKQREELSQNMTVRQLLDTVEYKVFLGPPFYLHSFLYVHRKIKRVEDFGNGKKFVTFGV
jgi:hypothetical protein